MMGMSSVEWSRYMHDSLEVPMEPEEISLAVVARLEQLYREGVPLLPGAEEAVRATAERCVQRPGDSPRRVIVRIGARAQQPQWLRGPIPDFDPDGLHLRFVEVASENALGVCGA